MTLKALKDTLELIVFKHSIFALPFIFSSYILIDAIQKFLKDKVQLLKRSLNK